MNDSRKNGDSEFKRWKRDAVLAGGVGCVAGLVMATATLAVGNITGGEAKMLVEAILPTSRYLCAAIMSATGTTLALMLTIVGMTSQSKANLTSMFYRRIKQIAFYDMLVLAATTVFLVAHCVPITKSDEIPGWWYTTVYYGLLTVSAALGGALVAIVVMLYTAIRDVIDAVGLDKNEQLIEE